MIDNDWDILIRKLDSIEEKIDRLEKDIQEIKPKYNPYQSDDPNAPYYKPIKGWLGPIPPTTEYIGGKKK